MNWNKVITDEHKSREDREGDIETLKKEVKSKGIETETIFGAKRI